MALLKKKPAQKSTEFPWVIVLGILFLSIFMGFIAGYLYENMFFEFYLVVAGLLILAMVVLPQNVTNILLALYIFIFIATYDFVGYDPLVTEPLKIFFADGILLFMVVLIIQILFHRISYWDLRSPVTLLLIGNLVYGFAAVIIGFSAGNSTNNVLGDFRRFFLYPLVALLPLSIKIKWSNLNKIFLWFCFALLIISAIAFIRVVTNSSWDPEQFSATNQFRAIGYFSGILLCIGVGLLYAISLNRHGIKKIVPWLILIIFEAAIFASGYRLLWILGIFLPIFITYFSSRGIGKVIRILEISVVVLLVLAALIFLIKSVSPDVYDRLSDRFITTINDLDFRNNIRFFAWTSAWSMFTSSPIIGVGIGDQFEFLSLSSGGQYYISHLTTHNILISLLYQTGILGAGLFLSIHFVFVYFIWRTMASFESIIRIPLLGLLAGYFSALIMGMVQPSFESPGAIVLFYLLIGLIINISRIPTSDLND
jgi:O-antigen ligase